MPRPKEFDADRVLDRAMHLFWKDGYNGTSTRNLVDHLGIGRQSIYNTFGDKQNLYWMSLGRYVESVLGGPISRLESAEASRPEIVEYFAFLVEFLDEDPPRPGCFLSNAILERVTEDETVARLADEHIQRMEFGFLNAIHHALQRREIASCHNPKALARSLSCATFGMSTYARNGATRNALVDIVTIALQPLY